MLRRAPSIPSIGCQAKRRQQNSVTGRLRAMSHVPAQFSDSTSACSNTVCVALSCLSGG